MRKIKVTVTTDGSGDATAYSPRVAGKVHSVSYVKPGAASYADGVDFTITSEATGQTIWAESNVNATAHRAPRQATHGTDGVASLFAAGGTAVQAPVALASDRIKIVVAQGGAAKVGAFHFLID
jgi:hypothetical protein